MTVAAFVLGLFVGVTIGVAIMALMFVARESEETTGPQAPIFPNISKLDEAYGRVKLRKEILREINRPTWKP